MKQILFKYILLLFGLLLSSSLYSKKYEIKLSMANSTSPYITLISLDRKFIIYEKDFSTEDDDKKKSLEEKKDFSIKAPRGSYVLCVSDGLEYKPTFIQVDIQKQSLDLGEITLEEFPSKPSVKKGVNVPPTDFFIIENKYDNREATQYILSPFGKRKTLFELLFKGVLFDLRVKKDTKQIAAFLLDNIPLELNAMELITFFKTTPAKDIVRIRKTTPTERYPAGHVEIITEVSYEVEDE